MGQCESWMQKGRRVGLKRQNQETGGRRIYQTGDRIEEERVVGERDKIVMVHDHL